MKLLTRNNWVILMALGITLIALSTGINFSEWGSGHGTSVWRWVLPLGILIFMFILLAMLVRSAKWDK
jgi:hypothetical protein